MSNINKREIHNQQLKAFITGFLSDPAHDNQSSRSLTAEVFRIALASLEADGSPANEGTITATLFKPVADLYEVTVPGGRSTTFTKDAAEASDCRVMGWSVQEYVRLERYQAAMLQGADGNSPVIPAGWKLVPVELTGAMTNAMTDAILDDLHNVDVWRSVLAAAPQQEA